jgi:hypothetical protein
MKEERIVVTIDAKGTMTAKTTGIKGERCIEELEALLSELAELDEIKHTREYKEKDAPVKNASQQRQRLGGGNQ